MLPSCVYDGTFIHASARYGGAKMHGSSDCTLLCACGCLFVCTAVCRMVHFAVGVVFSHAAGGVFMLFVWNAFLVLLFFFFGGGGRLRPQRPARPPSKAYATSVGQSGSCALFHPQVLRKHWPHVSGWANPLKPPMRQKGHGAGGTPLVGCCGLRVPRPGP